MHEINLQEFDGVKVGNTLPIHLIEHAIKVSAPAGIAVSWEYPGCISIVLTNGQEIAFGESLESASGYSWNNYDKEGTNTDVNSFDDLGEANLIAGELWRQISHLMAKEAN
jgi:hypothetical protein